MEWWGYAIVAVSVVSQALAWAAKLRWSAEYKDAKEAQVKLLEEQVKSVKDSKDAHIAAIPASPLTFLYGLCRKALSVPFDDPLSVLDATGVANIDAIRGCKPFLVPV